MLFAAPYYLIALSGILVPVAIHLWNRKKGKVVKVGSIKLLTASDTHKMSSIKMSEWLLMLIRIALIVVVVFLISELSYLTDSSSKGKVNRLVDRAYLHHTDMNKLINSFSPDDEVRLFENGFPHIDDNIGTDVRSDYWTTISHLNELNADSIVIYAPLSMRSFQGRYSPLPKNVAWIALPIAEEAKAAFINNAYIYSKDSLRVVVGIHDADQLKFEQHKIAIQQKTLLDKKVEINLKDSTVWFSDTPTHMVNIEAAPSLNIGIHAGEGYTQDVKYVEAAFATLAHYSVSEFAINELESDGAYDLIVWLSDEKYDGHKEKQAVLKLNEDEESKRIIARIDNRSYELSHRINPHHSPESILLKFPEALLKVINQEFLEMDIDHKNDERLLDINQLYVSSPDLNASLGTKNRSNMKPANHWLWGAFLLLFLIERGISLMKKT